MSKQGQLRKVIIVNDFSFINGGQTKVAFDTAKGLASRNIEVTFFAACGPADPALEEAGIKVVCLDQKDILNNPDRRDALIRGLWNGAAARALTSLLNDQDPSDTIVHCHGFAKALSPAIGPVMTQSAVPHVYTQHEYFLACPNGGFFDYQKNEICTRHALGIGCLTTNCDVRHPAHKVWRVTRQALALGIGRLPRGLSDVINISKTQQDAMAPYLSKETRQHFVPNPLDVPDKPPVRLEANDAFLFVGRFSPEKGGLLFAKAAKQAGVRAVFVGDGHDKDAILAANPDAEITGWQTPEQVDGWFDQARCLVFPSLWYETFGLVAYEALFRGVPIICGKWNASAETVEDGVNGLLVEDTEIDSWAQALGRIRDGDLSSGEAIHAQFADKDLGRDAYISRLLDVYQDILERTQA